MTGSAPEAELVAVAPPAAVAQTRYRRSLRGATSVAARIGDRSEVGVGRVALVLTALVLCRVLIGSLVATGGA